MIVTYKEFDNFDKNLIKLVDLGGVQCQVISIVSEENLLNKLSLEWKANNDSCLMINSRVLSNFANSAEDSNRIREFLFSEIPNVLIYNLYPNQVQNAIVNYLSNGSYHSVVDASSKYCSVSGSKDSKAICRQFSDLNIALSESEKCYGLAGNLQSTDVIPLIQGGGLPVFVQIRRNDNNVFLLGTDRMLDIDNHIMKQFNISDFFLQLVPLMMFLKHAYREKSWSNKKRYGSLIIDDPLLRKEYGFLNYFKLLAAMDKHQFFTNIAFIPYNFKRTRKEIAELFKRRRDRFGICVHGCDHTGNEFGSTDVGLLNRKVNLAIARMKIHERDMGLQYDKVMVFPQGKFSNAAMNVLKSNNFIACVNSELASVQGDIQLKYRDLLEVACLNYSSLALFIRRYPLEIEDFAFDLFLGRPALIVVHHDYFKNGYGEIEKFVDRINKLDSSIEWKSIGEIVKKTYLERKAEDGRVDIKMFSNVCEIENHWGRDTLFVVSKKENDGNLVRDVTVNGRAIKHDVEDGNLKFEVQIEEGATYTISINYKDDYPLLFEKQPFGERIKAFSRRRICEMRDNYLWKSELALKGVKKVIHMKQKYFH